MIVVFRPRPGTLEGLLNSLAHSGVFVVIIRNDGVESAIRIGALELTNRSNNIASAINLGARTAGSLGASHVLLLDQDSDVDSFDFIRSIQAELEHNPNSFQPVTISPDGLRRIETGIAMTSGLVLLLCDFENLNGYDERFPLDGADVDFTFRWHAAYGDFLPKRQSVQHAHEPGLPKRRTFLGRDFAFDVRPSSRYRSIASGRVGLMRTWAGRRPGWAVQDVLGWLKHLAAAFIVVGTVEGTRHLFWTVWGIGRELLFPWQPAEWRRANR